MRISIGKQLETRCSKGHNLFSEGIFNHTRSPQHLHSTTFSSKERLESAWHESHCHQSLWCTRDSHFQGPRGKVARSGPRYRLDKSSWLETRQVAHAQRRVTRVHASHRSEVFWDCESMSGRGVCGGNESRRNPIDLCDCPVNSQWHP